MSFCLGCEFVICIEVAQHNAMWWCFVKQGFMAGSFSVSLSSIAYQRLLKDLARLAP
jgi:hypothetical protein